MAQLIKSAPSILYKYRGDIERDVKCLLVDRQLYLSSPLKLNDPFDCYPALTDLLDDTSIEAELKGKPQHIVDETRRRLQLLRTSPAHQLRYLDEFYKEDLGRIGVLSLSIPRNQPLLWAHYAQNASGFAVGYRARTQGHLEALPALPVEYSNMRPRMPFLGDTDWQRILYTKSLHWSYEEEWRYVRVTEDGGTGLMTVPEGCIVEVCLGPRLESVDRESVIEAARALPEKPRILQAGLLDDRFELKFKPID